MKQVSRVVVFRQLITLLVFPLMLARIAKVTAQPATLSLLPTERPTNGPRLHPHEDAPAHIRGNPIPTTSAPTPSFNAVIPTLSPETHAPNAARQPHPNTQHRGPTDPPVPDHFPCFSGHATVQVQGKGDIEMKHLAIGDKVRDIDGKFVAVYSFGHYQPHMKGEYMIISVQGQDKPLEISKEHFVFKEGKAVPAFAIVAGDEIDVGLRATDGALQKRVVQKVSFATRQGVFAPHTTSGTLLVNNVAVSNYITVQPDTGEFLLFDRYNTRLSFHWLTHVFLTPHRVLCCHLVGIAYCSQRETYNANGISNWVEAASTKSFVLFHDKNSSTMAKSMAFTYLILWLLLALALHVLEVGWMYVLLMLLGWCYILRFKGGKLNRGM